MRSSILRDGAFVPDDGYDRGQMIVHPEEEWRRRVHACIYRPRLRAMWGLYVVLMLYPIGSFIMVRLNPGDFFGTPLLIAMIVVLSLVWVGVTLVFLRTRARAPRVGLYERGFQYNHKEFLPWETIEGVEMGEEGLRISIQVDEGRVFEWGPRRCVMAVLGEEGIVELNARVHAAGSPE